jgi:ribosome-associated toxin RatA of RatAB toxin-antitoxin module
MSIQNFLFAMVLVSLSFSSTRATAAEPILVTMTSCNDGMDCVQGSFWIKSTCDQVWHALADYEALPSFVSSVVLSHVKDRRTNYATVEQELVIHALAFTKHVHLLLAVNEQPRMTLHFVDVLGRDFSFYEGTWSLTPTMDGVQVSYRLVAKPSFYAPDFVTLPAMREGAAELLQEMQTEVTRRASSAN